MVIAGRSRTAATACRTALSAMGEPGRTLKLMLRISALSASVTRVPSVASSFETKSGGSCRCVTWTSFAFQASASSSDLA